MDHRRGQGVALRNWHSRPCFPVSDSLPRVARTTRTKKTSIQCLATRDFLPWTQRFKFYRSNKDSGLTIKTLNWSKTADNHWKVAIMESMRLLLRNLITKRDPRTKDMPLLVNPLFVFCALGGYLYVVRNGERWMKNYQPFELKNVIRTYNVFMMLANISFLYVGLSMSYFGGGYSFWCQGITGR